MAEAPRTGRALRLYQVAGILLLGWLAGRLPDLFQRQATEDARLRATLAPGDPVAGQAAATSGAVTPVDAAALAAEVASQVASETVARLVAAGWGPRSGAASAPVAPPQMGHAPVQPAARQQAAPETVVRIVVDQQQAAQSPQWSMAPIGAPPQEGRPGAPDPVAMASRPDVEPAAAKADRSRAEAAHALASEGYRAIQAGDRRTGAERLAQALATDPEAPQAEAWAADLRLLRKRLSLTFYALAREGAGGDAVAATPVLGGSQTGAAVGWTFDPLARRRITGFGRLAVGSDATGRIEPETAEAAVGVRVDPFPRVPVHVAIERRFALGAFARNDWSARIAGGERWMTSVAGRPVAIDVYGEGGLISFSDPDFYGGAEAKATTPVLQLDKVRLEAGVGGWGGAQQGFFTAHRFDVGPLLRFRFGSANVAGQLDYRVRVTGNAEPGSGVAFTILGDF
ncbi:MAG: hypothetical protein SNJ63_06795 [Sphingomonadaceae bacterium]